MIQLHPEGLSPTSALVNDENYRGKHKFYVLHTPWLVYNENSFQKLAF